MLFCLITHFIPRTIRTVIGTLGTCTAYLACANAHDINGHTRTSPNCTRICVIKELQAGRLASLAPCLYPQLFSVMYAAKASCIHIQSIIMHTL